MVLINPRIRRRTFVLIALCALLGLPACSGSTPGPAGVDGGESAQHALEQPAFVTDHFDLTLPLQLIYHLYLLILQELSIFNLQWRTTKQVMIIYT